MKISTDKQYTTRCGYEVRIYCTDAGGGFPIHGAYYDGGGWCLGRWTEDGSCLISNVIAELDLIEVKPRIQREVFLNLYEDGVFVAYESKDKADEFSPSGRIACVKITIDCEHGEGLD